MKLNGRQKSIVLAGRASRGLSPEAFRGGGHPLAYTPVKNVGFEEVQSVNICPRSGA